VSLLNSFWNEEEITEEEKKLEARNPQSEISSY